MNEFILRKVGLGLWHCWQADSHVIGAGSRPDLAIRDFKTQTRRGKQRPVPAAPLHRVSYAS